MSLIDESYFVGERNVPNSSDTAVLERLTYFINKYEPQLLQDLLGYELYALLADALQTQKDASGSPHSLPTRFDSLVNGTVYTGQDTKQRRWRGLIYTVGTVPMSLVADYVYWHWLKDQQTQTVGLGEVATKGQNSYLVTPMIKQNQTWNDMARAINELYYYLLSTSTDYPEWTSQAKVQMLGFFRPQNQFGI